LAILILRVNQSHFIFHCSNIWTHLIKKIRFIFDNKNGQSMLSTLMHQPTGTRISLSIAYSFHPDSDKNSIPTMLTSTATIHHCVDGNIIFWFHKQGIFKDRDCWHNSLYLLTRRKLTPTSDSNLIMAQSYCSPNEITIGNMLVHSPIPFVISKDANCRESIRRIFINLWFHCWYRNAVITWWNSHFSAWHSTNSWLTCLMIKCTK